MNTPLAVAKMSGAGNDFLVIDARERGPWSDEPDWVRRVCRRAISVGADGVLFVEPTAPGRVRVRFRNPDGSPAFCGNGSRCAARFARERGMCEDAVVLETEVGDVRAEVEGLRVRLWLPAPQDRGVCDVTAAGRTFSGRWIEAGVPHFLIDVADVAAAPLERWGPVLRRHDHFGQAGVNVDLLERHAPAELRIRTWERGVERETLACGSGAVAAAFVARLAGGPESISVVPASGIALEVGLPGPRTAPRVAVLGGEARFVLEGRLHPEAVLVGDR